MRLLDRLIRRYGDTFWEGQASGAAILTSTYASPDRETILPQLTAWAQQTNSSSAPVFSAIVARMSLLSEATFQYQAADDKHLFGDTALTILERPWPRGTSGALIARMEQDASLAGNAYIWAAPGEDRLVRLRPDWITIVSEVVTPPGGGWYRNVIGYWWEPPKSVLDAGNGEMYPAEEVAHWAPIPDPDADFRGMSWLTPVYRDINADSGMVEHKIKYLQNSATPNVIIRYAQKLQPGTIDSIRERMTARYGGVSNAYKTLVLDQGADLTLVGNSLAQMDFTNVAQAGAERILSAAGVPPLLVGLESVKGAGKSYEEVIARFSDLTLWPLWRSLCGSLESLVPGLPSPGKRLWVATGDIPALQDGKQVQAQVALIRAQALLAYVEAGYTRDSAVSAVDAGDITLLEPDPDAVTGPAMPTPVQHMLPQPGQPGATAEPLPPGSTPRLPVGTVSPGDGGNQTRPAGKRPASARRSELVNGNQVGGP